MLSAIIVVSKESGGRDAIKKITELFPVHHVIDFYTMDLVDLHDVAKHRIMSAPCVVILDGSKVVCRLTEIPSDAAMAQIVQSLSQ